MKKYFIFILFCIFLSSFAIAAIPGLGVFKQDGCIELKQTCTINGSFCDGCNISSIDYPNSSIAMSNLIMTKRIGDFNYSFCNASARGEYHVNGHCTFGSDILKNWVYYFEVTESGEKVSLSNIILTIALLLFAGLCFVIGKAFQPDKWVVKTFFFIAALLVGLLALNSARIIATESVNLSKTATTSLIVAVAIVSLMFLYMLVYFTIDTFKQVRRKKEVRWNY